MPIRERQRAWNFRSAIWALCEFNRNSWSARETVKHTESLGHRRNCEVCRPLPDSTIVYGKLAVLFLPWTLLQTISDYVHASLRVCTNYGSLYEGTASMNR